jgi:hypothetical protein
MKNESIVLLPVLLNGELFTVDPTGNMAITVSGKAIRLVDPDQSTSRFK